VDSQISRWIPLSIALAASLAVLIRNVQGSKERRSWGQLLIFTLYRGMRVIWAILRGIDLGYLEYRRVLKETAIEIQNERCLGKLIKKRDAEKAPLYGFQHEA
jgi:hypothetical protein